MVWAVVQTVIPLVGLGLVNDGFGFHLGVVDPPGLEFLFQDEIGLAESLLRVSLPDFPRGGDVAFDLPFFIADDNRLMEEPGPDLRAAVDAPLCLEPGRLVLVPTGLRLEIPSGYEAQVRPRSGLAVDHQIGVLNSPGTIDSDYRGELKVLLFNFGRDAFHIARGERIAQLVFARVEHPPLEIRDLSGTDRAGGGFGHTGSR